MFIKRSTLLLSLLLLLHGSPAGAAKRQSTDDGVRAAKVKAALARLGTGHRAQVKIELRNLSEIEGYVQQAGDRDFYLILTKGESVGSSVVIPYREVVKLTGRRVSLSFEGVALDGIGTWDSVRELERGDVVELTLTDGRTVAGRLYGSTDGAVTVLRSGEAVVYRREEVLLLSRLTGEPSSLPNSVLRGMVGGVRASGEVPVLIPPVRGPISGEGGGGGRRAEAGGKALGAAVGAIVGAGAALLKYRSKGPGRVIIYAR